MNFSHSESRNQGSRLERSFKKFRVRNLQKILFPSNFVYFSQSINRLQPIWKKRIKLLTKLSSMRRWSRKAVTSRFSSGEKFNQGSRVFIDCFLYERTLEAGKYENKPRVISALWANTGSTSILFHTLIFILKQQIIRSLQSIYQSHLRRSSPCTRSLNLFQSNVPDSLHACSGPLLVREGLLYQANLIFVTIITTAGCKVVQLECKKNALHCVQNFRKLLLQIYFDKYQVCYQVK